MGYQSAVCPRCGQLDAVRKVSGVVSEGTSLIEQVGVAPSLMGTDFYLIGMQGSSRTNLAQRLAPPARRPGGIGWRVFLAGAAILLGSIMACGLSMFAVTPEFGRFACGNWVLGILVVAGMGGITPLLGIPGVRRKQTAYDVMMEAARAKWSRLYYCTRDDIAFSPDEGTVVSIPSLSSYLYG